MPPTARKTTAPAAAGQKPSAAVFLHEHLIGMPADDERLPGSHTAAVLAAQQSGRVVVATPYVERTEAQDGGVLVVWAVPVEAV